MPDTIPPSDQALIDAAIEAGRVTQIETGVSGLYNYVWKPYVNNLVDTDPNKPRYRYNARFFKQDLKARRRIVLERLKTGESMASIARDLGVTSVTISNDRRALVLSGDWE